MESLRLEGTTIRGVVQGRAINCVISSAPAGLALPRGQYWLSAAEKSPVYGQFLSIEAARGTAVAPGVTPRAGRQVLRQLEYIRCAPGHHRSQADRAEFACRARRIQRPRGDRAARRHRRPDRGLDVLAVARPRGRP
jgi:hypothetical protein